MDLPEVTQGALSTPALSLPGLCTAASGLVLDLRAARSR